MMILRLSKWQKPKRRKRKRRLLKNKFSNRRPRHLRSTRPKWLRAVSKSPASNSLELAKDHALAEVVAIVEVVEEAMAAVIVAVIAEVEEEVIAVAIVAVIAVAIVAAIVVAIVEVVEEAIAVAVEKKTRMEKKSSMAKRKRVAKPADTRASQERIVLRHLVLAEAIEEKSLIRRRVTALQLRRQPSPRLRKRRNPIL